MIVVIDKIYSTILTVRSKKCEPIILLGCLHSTK